MNKHLDNPANTYRDEKSYTSGFRRPGFWKPMQLDLMIRLMPLWLERVASCHQKNDIGAGENEMQTSVEELGYKLILLGPQIDFYLTLFAKRIMGKMKLSYLSGQIKIIGITCTPNIWWYLTILAQKYGADVEFKVSKQGDVVTIKAMSTFKSLFSAQRVGKLVYEKKHFKRRKITENGQTRVISKFVGRSRIVCDPEHPFKMAYKNGNIRILFYLQKFNNLNIPTNVSLVGQGQN